MAGLYTEFSARRHFAAPKIPWAVVQIASGHDLPADIVNGFAVPAGMPRPIIDFLHREVVKVMALPDTREKLAGMGFDPVASTPEESGTWLKTELGRWTKVIRDARLELQ